MPYEGFFEIKFTKLGNGTDHCRGWSTRIKCNQWYIYQRIGRFLDQGFRIYYSRCVYITGILLRSARFKNYPIGKKYTLHYLNLRPKSISTSNPLNTAPAKQPDAH